MLLNQYELIYVAQPQLNATDLEGLSTKVTGFIEKANGFSGLRLFTMNERVTQSLYV